MTYTPKTDWADLPSTTTPILAVDLLRIEAGIDAAHDVTDVAVVSTTVDGLWRGTQAAYDALGTYDPNTIYFIT